MRKTRFFSLTVFFLALSSPLAYGQLRNLTVTSYEIVSYNIFTDKLTLNLTIKNDSTDFTLKSFTGLVYHNREVLITITAANIFISNGVSSVGVVCNVSRCKGVPFLRLTQCLFPFNIRNYTVDVSVAIQYPNIPIQYKKLKDISLSSKVVIN